MTKTRPIWIMPDNDIASYPFDGVTASGVKGYFYEARAVIQPVPLSFSAIDNSLPGTTKVMQLYRTDIYPRPAVVTPPVYNSGTITPASYARKSYLFIKKPTLTKIEPTGIASTTSGTITSALFNYAIQNNATLGSDTMHVLVRLDSNNTISYDIDGGFDAFYPEVKTFDFIGETAIGSLGIGETYSILVQQLPTYDWTVVASGLYFYTSQNFTHDTKGTDAIEDDTFTITPYGGSIDDTVYTTTDVPSWTIGANCVTNEPGSVAFIEWLPALRALQATTSGYIDYQPWELR